MFNRHAFKLVKNYELFMEKTQRKNTFFKSTIITLIFCHFITSNVSLGYAHMLKHKPPYITVTKLHNSLQKWVQKFNTDFTSVSNFNLLKQN